MFGCYQLRVQCVVLCLCSLLDVAVSVIPWRVSWADEAVGPDGPWHALMIGFDAATQNISLLPSLTKTTFLVNDLSCTNSKAACPLPLPTMWSNATAHAMFNWMDGPSFDTSSWDDSLAPLQLQGSGVQAHETLHLFNEPKTNEAEFDDQGIVVTQDTIVTYPGGANYTMDVGFFSLNGAASYQNWTSDNGSTISLKSQLPSIYNQGDIPSNSFSLHMGSPSYNIPGSLVLGGYDRSRVSTAPITSSNMTFQLTGLSLTVLNSTSEFLDPSPNASTSGIVIDTVMATDTLTVLPNPGVPYLYFPRATCDAIAAHLPVTYASELGLYLWNTTSPAYTDILTSPQFLTLNLTSGDDATATTTISVPFALLNLTLTAPLSFSDEGPLQYFPCSPYSPPSTSSTYHLGRAFLQAAFLAHSYNTNTSFLAQAPGPDFTYGIANEVITTLDPSDPQVAPLVDVASWPSTWSSTLPSINASCNATSSANTSACSSNSSTALSHGAIAGIVVGVLVAAALIFLAVFIVCRRRRRGQGRHIDSTTASESTGGTADVGLAADEWVKTGDYEMVFAARGQPTDVLEAGSVGIEEAGSRSVYEVGGGHLHEVGAGHLHEVEGRDIHEVGGRDVHEVDVEGNGFKRLETGQWGGEKDVEMSEVLGAGRKGVLVELEGSGVR